MIKTITFEDNRRDKKAFFCTTCHDFTPMVHTGTMNDTWIVLSVHESYGCVLYELPLAVLTGDVENLTAICAVCGANIPGYDFTELVYDNK